MRNRDTILTHSTSAPWDCNNANKIMFKPNLVRPCNHSDSAEVWKEASVDSIAVHV